MGTLNRPRSKNGIYMHEIRTNLFAPQIVGIYFLPHYDRCLETSFACPHQAVAACWLTTWVTKVVLLYWAKTISKAL